MLRQWLHSGDPRLITWTADFARRTHHAGSICEMPTLLENWSLPALSSGYESQTAQRPAVTAVLDTLIQENAKVPIPAIRAVAEFFPSQAVILIGRLPGAESRATLGEWAHGVSGSWSGRVRERVASMLLAKDPDSSFVASIVAASEENLQILVTSKDSSRVGSDESSCGDRLGSEILPGWPRIYAYDLVENYSNPNTLPVIDLDGDRIDFRRFEENLAWGPYAKYPGVGGCAVPKWNALPRISINISRRRCEPGGAAIDNESRG
jgi:hypothetical protein